ncbi:conjugal transfer protein [Shouchella miscanthi]|uniref:conjugal transfer protein n=1 Tax=Shouchella miscanthi TaxID=2598861 RepID=UPI0011A4C9EC|nr:conjugal transfer protein [Shouchella miscanthi]
MRYVFNYRKAMREPKQVQQLTKDYSLPFAFQLIHVINFFLFFFIVLGVGLLIRMGFPHAFGKSFLVFLIGIPFGLTVLVTKIKPEGKNLYLYFLDVARYYLQIKLPKKRFCQDHEVQWMDEPQTFKPCVKVVQSNYEYVKNTDEDATEELTIDENGRRVGVLSSQESIHSHAK